MGGVSLVAEFVFQEKILGWFVWPMTRRDEGNVVILQKHPQNLSYYRVRSVHAFIPMLILIWFYCVFTFLPTLLLIDLHVFCSWGLLKKSLLPKPGFSRPVVFHENSRYYYRFHKLVGKANWRKYIERCWSPNRGNGWRGVLCWSMLIAKLWGLLSIRRYECETNVYLLLVRNKRETMEIHQTIIASL